MAARKKAQAQAERDAALRKSGLPKSGGAMRVKGGNEWVSIENMLSVKGDNPYKVWMKFDFYRRLIPYFEQMKPMKISTYI